MARDARREWLRGEVTAWEQRGLLSPAQADAIRALYPVERGGTAWGVIVFASLGAVIAGLGVILLFAYNWDRIPRLGKLGLVCASLLAAHGAAWLTRRRRPDERGLPEGLHLLGTMLFGAGIWLVAQAYHIGEHYPNAFLIWSIGALALGLAWSSVPQLLLGTVLLVVWSGMERMAFDTPQWAGWGVPLALLLPFAWRLRSRLLAAVAIPACVLGLAWSVPDLPESGRVTVGMLMGVGAVLIGAAVHGRRAGGGLADLAPVLGF